MNKPIDPEPKLPNPAFTPGEILACVIITLSIVSAACYGIYRLWCWGLNLAP